MNNDRNNTPAGNAGTSNRTDAAKQQAGQQASQVKDEAKRHAGELKDEAKRHFDEFKQDAKDHAEQAKQEARGHADAMRHQGGTNTDQAKREAQGHAGAMKQDAKAHAGDLKGQAKEHAQDLAGEAKDRAMAVKDRATDALRSNAAEQKERATSTLSNVAQALLVSSQTLRDRNEDAIGRAFEQAAEQVDRFAGAMNRRDVGDLADEVQRFAKRQPGLFLGSAFALGLIGARFLKASSDRAERNDRSDAVRERYGLGGNRPSYDEREVRTPTSFESGRTGTADAMEAPGMAGTGMGTGALRDANLGMHGADPTSARRNIAPGSSSATGLPTTPDRDSNPRGMR